MKVMKTKPKKVSISGFVLFVSALEEGLMGVVTQQLILHLDLIANAIGECGGVFINYETCPSEQVVVARVNPVYAEYIVGAIQTMGFIIRDYEVSGIQTYIYIGGFMY